MTLTSANTSIDKEKQIEENLDFILDHLNDPLFPRTIMTNRLNYQKEVINKQEVLASFKASGYRDCRINAYPAYTEYKGINLTPISFIMIDMDLKDAENSQKKLNNILRTTLNNISDKFHGAKPTVLWTGNGYHIYQPVSGFILEEIDRFVQFIDNTKKDLTSRFMQFAEAFLTDKKSDPQHRPSIKSCLIRIPGTINTKCNQEVKIIQRWDGNRPPINFVLREFRTWLVAENIKSQLIEKRHLKYAKRSRNSSCIYGKGRNTILWIEKLLQTPIADHRKYALWKILTPYLFNIRQLSEVEVMSITLSWLKKCHLKNSLDFNAIYLIKQNIRSSKRGHYLPISYVKLSSENKDLYNIILVTSSNNELDTASSKQLLREGI